MIFEPLEHEWKDVPGHMRDGITNYVQHGIPGGGFLNSVFENNLWEAVNRMDGINAYHIQSLMRFLDRHTPRDCWGSKEKVKNWIAAGGLDGIIGKRGKIDDNDISEDQPF